MQKISQVKKNLSLAFLIYLRTLAKLQLKKINPTLIGITGSAGKTSTMYACQAVLKDRFKVRVSEKANSESGIPLDILGLKPVDYSFFDWLRLLILAPIKLLTNWEKYDVYIIELGVDSPYPPKNMGYLLTIIRPKIGIFLNVFPVHSQFFDDLVAKEVVDQLARREAVTDYIALEKGKLIESLPQAGTAILNLDDRRVKLWQSKTKASLITFSIKQKANLEAKDVKFSLKEFSMKVVEGKTSETLKLKFLLDEHYASNFLAALCLAKALGINLKDSIKGLENNFHLPPGRMTVIEGVKNTTLLDSTYNASRSTMINALNTLDRVTRGRRVAVLGDMRELGEVAKKEHEEVASTAFQTTDLIFTIGPLMQTYFVPKLLKLGFLTKNLKSFSNPYLAVNEIKRQIKAGDTVLIKGSQNTLFLEIIVQALMKQPKDADRLLCRRGKFWDKMRSELQI